MGCREGWSSVEGCRWGVPGAPTERAGRRRAGACGLQVGAVGVGVRVPAPAGGGQHAVCGPCPRVSLQTVAPLGSGAGPSPPHGRSRGCLRTDWPSRRSVGRQSQGGPGSHCRDRRPGPARTAQRVFQGHHGELGGGCPGWVVLWWRVWDSGVPCTWEGATGCREARRTPWSEEPAPRGGGPQAAGPVCRPGAGWGTARRGDRQAPSPPAHTVATPSRQAFLQETRSLTSQDPFASFLEHVGSWPVGDEVAWCRAEGPQVAAPRPRLEGDPAPWSFPGACGSHHKRVRAQGGEHMAMADPADGREAGWAAQVALRTQRRGTASWGASGGSRRAQLSQGDARGRWTQQGGVVQGLRCGRRAEQDAVVPDTAGHPGETGDL